MFPGIGDCNVASKCSIKTTIWLKRWGNGEGFSPKLELLSSSVYVRQTRCKRSIFLSLSTCVHGRPPIKLPSRRKNLQNSSRKFAKIWRICQKKPFSAVFLTNLAKVEESVYIFFLENTMLNRAVPSLYCAFFYPPILVKNTFISFPYHHRSKNA